MLIEASIKKMKIIQYTSHEANIILSLKELKILKKSIHQINYSISIHEFYLRIGSSKMEMNKFLKLIDKLIIQENNCQTVGHKFFFKEIIIINNILNEICNGIRISDFDVNIGASFEEVDHLSLLISKLGKKMYSIQSSAK